MEQKRKFQRFPIALKAHCISAGSMEIRDCRITEISRAGIILYLHLKERVKVGQIVMLEIDFPGRDNPINALIKLKWIQELEDTPEFNYVAGGKLTIIKSEDKKALLDYAYADLLKKEKED